MLDLTPTIGTNSPSGSYRLTLLRCVLCCIYFLFLIPDYCVCVYKLMKHGSYALINGKCGASYY